MHLIQIDHQEEQQSATSRCRPIRFACFVDSDLSRLGDFLLFHDVCCNALRLFQILDQLDVLCDVALGISEAEQQVVFELFHFNHETVLIRDQLRLLLF